MMLTSPMAAQELIPNPPAPESHILDDARLFALDPKVLAGLSARLIEISDRTGYQVYVAVFDSLIGSTAKDQARVLQEAWIGENPGVVLVLESDSAIYHLGWSRSPDAVSESGETVPVISSSDLAPQEQVRISNLLSELESPEKGKLEAAEKLITTFADEIDRVFKKVAAVEPARWNVRLLMLGAGLLAGMLLIALLIGAWTRRTYLKVEERLVFPKVSVGMRLGAPCGGGKVSSRSFDVLPRESV